MKNDNKKEKMAAIAIATGIALLLYLVMNAFGCSDMAGSDFNTCTMWPTNTPRAAVAVVGLWLTTIVVIRLSDFDE